MIIILVLVISLLTYWSLRLMRRAHEQREFSLMFAGALVAIAGAALIAAYSLMVGCVGYLGSTSALVPPTLTAYSDETWVPLRDVTIDATIAEDFHRVSAPKN